MDEKEKKAIERIDYIQDFIIENGQYNADVNDMAYFSRILNLIKNQQKEIKELQVINQMQKYRIEVMDERELISRDEVEEIIKTRIKEIQNMYDKLSKNPKEHLHSKTEYLIVICELQSILNKIKGDDK